MLDDVFCVCVCVWFGLVWFDLLVLFVVVVAVFLVSFIHYSSTGVVCAARSRSICMAVRHGHQQQQQQQQQQQRR